MKAKTLENIDATIQLICKSIQEILSKTKDESQLCYPNDTIKALADLIQARALIEITNKHSYSSLDEASSE